MLNVGQEGTLGSGTHAPVIEGDASTAGTITPQGFLADSRSNSIPDEHRDAIDDTAKPIERHANSYQAATWIHSTFPDSPADKYNHNISAARERNPEAQLQVFLALDACAGSVSKEALDHHVAGGKVPLDAIQLLEMSAIECSEIHSAIAPEHPSSAASDWLMASADAGNPVAKAIAISYQDDPSLLAEVQPRLEAAIRSQPALGVSAASMAMATYELAGPVDSGVWFLADCLSRPACPTHEVKRDILLDHGNFTGGELIHRAEQLAELVADGNSDRVIESLAWALFSHAQSMTENESASPRSTGIESGQSARN